MTLPAEHVPFPVAPSFVIRPDMRRWPPGDRGHLRLDARYPSYLSQKLRLLAADPAGCRVPAPDADPGELTAALLRAAERLAEEAPVDGDERVRPVAVDGRAVRFPLLGAAVDRRDVALSEIALPGRPPPGLPALAARARAHLAALPPPERLMDVLALAVQEDLVLMRADAPAPEAPSPRGARAVAPARAGGRGPAGGPAPAGHAELLHVCFPSSWDPAARAGADFAALHAPVPHGEVLRRAAPQVVRAMVSKGPFVRYVWSLAADGRLDRNPRRHRGLRAGAPPRALWFRVERQTVMPLVELDRALFTIRVYTAPLASVLSGEERRRTLAAAIASMDEALLAYKGIGAGREALLAWLRAGGATAS